MREVVCEAADQGICQIVITPHDNAAHDDQVHLEAAEHARPVWIR